MALFLSEFRSQVITDQHIIKGQKENGFPVRKWKISLMGINANGEEELLPYVDHVEYILHQSFDQPLRSMPMPFYQLLSMHADGRDSRTRSSNHSIILNISLFSDLEVTKFPFQLQEKGWGEFDMKIMLHFVDNADSPAMLDHDLNFQLNHYEVEHTLVRLTFASWMPLVFNLVHIVHDLPRRVLIIVSSSTCFSRSSLISSQIS